MLNNIWPWGQTDYCLQQSWYIANDVWFLVVLLIQADYYMKSRRFYYIVGFGLSALAGLVQIIQICANDFSASYLTFSDEYWKIYYDKPYTHFHSYNIGIFLGSAYFSWKCEMNKG